VSMCVGVFGGAHDYKTAIAAATGDGGPDVSALEWTANGAEDKSHLLMGCAVLCCSTATAALTATLVAMTAST